MVTLEIGPNVLSMIGSIITVLVLYLTQRSGFKQAQKSREEVATKVDADNAKKDDALAGIHVLVNSKSEMQEKTITELTGKVSSMEKIISEMIEASKRGEKD